MKKIILFIVFICSLLLNIKISYSEVIMSNINNQRTNVMENERGFDSNPSIKWETLIANGRGREEWQNPVIYKDKIYFTSKAFLYVVDLETGKILEAKNGYQGHPTIENDIIYVSSGVQNESNGFSAILLNSDGKIGSVKWNIPLAIPIYDPWWHERNGIYKISPIIINDVIIKDKKRDVVCFSGLGLPLYVLDKYTGEKIWEITAPNGNDFTLGYILYENGKIITFTAESAPTDNPNINLWWRRTKDAKVYAFNLSTGEKAWEFSIATFAVGTPVIYDGHFYFADGLHDIGASLILRKINIETGNEVWNLNLTLMAGLKVNYGSISVLDNIAIIGGGAVNKIVAVDLNTKTIKWTHTVSGASEIINYLISKPERRIYFGVARNNVLTFCAVNLDDGKEVWKFEKELSDAPNVYCSYIVGTCAIYKNKIYFTTFWPKLYCLSGTNSIEKEIKIENKYLQSYPNPFNPECYIAVSGQLSAVSKIKIYNILGQAVRELNVNNGSNSVYWDGRDNFGKELSSGMYFYEMLANNKVQNYRKMLMLK